ncbi:outer membrane protein assembly factor BamB family protein [Stieleria mannarensis]|uniref:outer membrane protein assembly factor BamB family protein n=1 Tax=Stieleria mannarensis TaxID=2755585 RepID=UPI0015FFABCE|nr:PQQ-binding-like beta-propeller repeat protein [Rhodopirellula sp. JC639]
MAKHVLFLASLAVSGSILTGPGGVFADDWSGWLGVNRDGVYRETGVVDEIPASGLPIKWRTPIAGGYAGPAVADGKVFVFDYQRSGGDVVNDPGSRAKLTGKERLLALDANTGVKIWEYSYDRPYEISYPAGPRATPTVDQDKVYLLGAEGDLTCLSVDDGSLVWTRNLPQDFGAEVPIWGFSGHPLVDGDLLYTMVGGDGQGVVAFDKATGEVRWKSLDARAGYCAPRIIEAGGVRQLIVFHPEAVQGLDPASGKPFWNVPITPSYDMSIAVPMVDGDLMYASGIHAEAVMIRLGTDSPSGKEFWRGGPKNAVHSSNAPPMFVDGVVYGTDCVKGNLIAVDASNGDRLWETFQPTVPGEKRFAKHGTAFLTRLGETDRYLVMSETGDLIIAELTAKGYEEKGRMHVVEPTNEAFGRPVVWTHPAYAGKTAFVRNDKEIVAVDLSR